MTETWIIVDNYPSASPNLTPRLEMMKLHEIGKCRRCSQPSHNSTSSEQHLDSNCTFVSCRPSASLGAFLRKIEIDHDTYGHVEVLKQFGLVPRYGTRPAPVI